MSTHARLAESSLGGFQPVLLETKVPRPLMNDFIEDALEAWRIIRDLDNSAIGMP
jgi:hypothetical protein